MSEEPLWDDVAAWLAGRTRRVIETSCARIHLTETLAWKIKRPVKLPFLDFSTVAKRKWALDRELAFNRRWASDIYRAVRPICRDGGSFAIDGTGEAIEWLLEMRRFDSDAVLANHPKSVDGDLAETIGRMIARDHLAAPIAPDGGGAAGIAYTAGTNEAALRASPLDHDGVERLIEATRAEADRIAPLLESRRAEGFARPCHGDLHLGNILMEGGAPVFFDCIEFNDRLSLIDVLYDVAFPVMDLAVRGRAGPANRLLNAWLDEAARGFPPTHWDGLAALALFLSIRAAVRAHVTAATGEAEAAHAYLAAALAALDPPAPRLFAVGGLSGSGKTHFARRLAPLVPVSPGAVVLRSDEIRLRLVGAGVHDPEADAAVYDEMFDLAARVLAAGRCAILDATFLDTAIRARADRLGALGIWLDGDPAILRQRLAARRGDASEADAAVLARQLTRDLGPVTWRRVPITSDLAGMARELTLAPKSPSAMDLGS